MYYVEERIMRWLSRGERGPAALEDPSVSVDVSQWMRQNKKKPFVTKEKLERDMLRADMLAYIGAEEQDLRRPNDEGVGVFNPNRRVFSTADALDTSARQALQFEFRADPESVAMYVYKLGEKRTGPYGFVMADWNQQPLREEPAGECINWAIGNRIVKWHAEKAESPYTTAEDAMTMFAEVKDFLATDQDVLEVYEFTTPLPSDAPVEPTAISWA